MAKDPAFLFYPNDWIGGTMILNRHQKGCYLDLLVAQFNNGPLSLDTIKAVLGQDQAAWTVLSKKFKQTGEGLWYNERMETEKKKRGEFIERQKINGKKGGRKPTLNPTLNPNPTNKEDGDEIGNLDGTLLIPSMISNWKKNNPNAYIRLFEDSEQLLGISKKIKEWMSLKGDVTTYDNAEIIKKRWIEIVEFLCTESFLKKYSLTQINSHFPSVIQAFNNRNNGSHQQAFRKSSGKDEGAEQLLSSLKADLPGAGT